MKQMIHILIVEDEAISAMTLQAIFRLWGYDECRTVARAEDALISIQQEQPDLLLVDVSLGGEMDGFELVEKISGQSRAKVIFMTGYDEKFLEDRLAPLDVLAYLTKPMDLDRLKSIIESAFSEEVPGQY